MFGSVNRRPSHFQRAVDWQSYRMDHWREDALFFMAVGGLSSSQSASRHSLGSSYSHIQFFETSFFVSTTSCITASHYSDNLAYVLIGQDEVFQQRREILSRHPHNLFRYEVGRYDQMLLRIEEDPSQTLVTINLNPDVPSIDNNQLVLMGVGRTLSLIHI